MNKRLSEQSADKLQTILSKRFGRELTLAELEEAYGSLMDFAYALVDLEETDKNRGAPLEKRESIGI